MIGLFGRQGPAATLRQDCPQMTQRRCNTITTLQFSCTKSLQLQRLIGISDIAVLAKWVSNALWLARNITFCDV